MPFSRYRERAPRLIRYINEASKDRAILKYLSEGILLLSDAEQEDAINLPEILEMIQCIDKKLHALDEETKPDLDPFCELTDDETDEEEEDSGIDYRYIIDAYQQTKESHISLDQFFNDARKDSREKSIKDLRKRLGERMTDEDEVKLTQEMTMAAEKQVWLGSNVCSFSYIKDSARMTNFAIAAFIGQYNLECLWKGILLLIDAEVEGIEELAEIIDLRKSVNKRLETLNMPDCFAEVRFENHIKRYITGYLTAQKNKISLAEHFNETDKIEDEKKKKEKEKQRKKMKELMNKSKEEELSIKKLVKECMDKDLKIVIPDIYADCGLFSPTMDNPATDDVIVPVSKKPTMILPVCTSVFLTREAMKSDWHVLTTQKRSRSLLSRAAVLNFSGLAIRRKYDCKIQSRRISSQRISLPKVISMATLTECLVPAPPTMDKEVVLATFGVDDVRMPAAKTASESMHSLFWRGCTDIFYWSFAYHTRKIPSLFRRSLLH